VSEGGGIVTCTEEREELIEERRDFRSTKILPARAGASSIEASRREEGEEKREAT